MKRTSAKVDLDDLILQAEHQVQLGDRARLNALAAISAGGGRAAKIAMGSAAGIVAVIALAVVVLRLRNTGRRDPAMPHSRRALNRRPESRANTLMQVALSPAVRPAINLLIREMMRRMFAQWGRISTARHQHEVDGRPGAAPR